MTQIYDSYDEEPKDLFHPLNDSQYAEFYQLEMASFAADLPFYLQHSPEKSSLLELGCGTGRLSGQLIKAGHQLTGIDLNPAMLKKAVTDNPTMNCQCADVCNLELPQQFSAILAPYNLFNILGCENILKTLHCCQNLLKDRGKILCEIAYLEEMATLYHEKKSFQFQIFDNEKGDRLVKEIIRRVEKKSTVAVEERYRFRPKNKGNHDYSRHYTTYIPSRTEWTELIKDAGFTITTSYTDYNLKTNKSDTSGRLLAVLQSCSK